MAQHTSRATLNAGYCDVKRQQMAGHATESRGLRLLADGWQSSATDKKLNKYCLGRIVLSKNE